MIPAKYFFDENGNVAKIISITLNSEICFEGEEHTEEKMVDFYKVAFLYPDNTAIEREMSHTINDGYMLFSNIESALVPVKIVNETIYFADDTEHIPQENTIYIDPMRVNNLAKSFSLLSRAMELTIHSMLDMLNTQK